MPTGVGAHRFELLAAGNADPKAQRLGRHSTVLQDGAVQPAGRSGRWLKPPWICSFVSLLAYCLLSCLFLLGCPFFLFGALAFLLVFLYSGTPFGVLLLVGLRAPCLLLLLLGVLLSAPGLRPGPSMSIVACWWLGKASPIYHAQKYHSGLEKFVRNCTFAKNNMFLTTVQTYLREQASLLPLRPFRL